MLELPICAYRDAVIEAVRDNKVVIVVGETGSGKTTQLPRFFYESGLGKGGVIGITEPRRIAATSVARFVANNLGTKLGDVVGYQVRFDDQTAADTAIKFMTDGILLREIQVDPDLRKYSVIMIDEAHERNCNVDFLLGLLKDLLTRRDDLKVIVSSATIDAEKFSQYFNGAPIITVSGRPYPVDVVWGDTNYTEHTIVDAVVKKIIKIHKDEDNGDVLVFMTGVEEINKVIKGIEEHGACDLIALPAHASLTPENQQKIFDRFPGKRKVVVATSIAETSITIDGLVYVVDSGFIKQTHFHPESGIQSLDVILHSKAGCNQRMGRAGRTSHGTCFRMFTEESFGERPDFTEPEILRMNLSGVVLLMESIGVEGIEDFDFIDPPDKETFHEAYEMLIALGAITRGEKGLTDIGRDMVRLPLDPRIARMVLEAKKHGCVEDIATIAALLSVRSVFPRPKDKESEADEAHAKFKDNKSDALTFLRVWKAYKVSGFDKGWCLKNFLHSRSLWEAKNIRDQLLHILRQSDVEITQSGDDEVVMKSVAAGLIYNLFQHGSRHEYNGMMRDLCGVYIHPGSSVFGFSDPRWIVTSEIMETSKRFARNVSAINVEWLPDLAPSRFWFGSSRLVSYTEGDESVLARQHVLCRSSFSGEESSVGFREINIPVPEARELQNNCIAEARRNGWIPLSFEESGILDMEAVYDGVRYRCRIIPMIRPEAKKVYYCKIQPRSYGEGMEADPQFPLLSFHADKEAVGAVSQPPVSETESSKDHGESCKVKAFTQAKAARHFQCTGCGAMERVTRREFQRYNQGESLELTCIGCGVQAVVAK